MVEITSHKDLEVDVDLFGFEVDAYDQVVILKI